MKLLGRIIRIVVVILCFALSFAVLIPPVPSEASPEEKVSFLDLASLISIVLFSISATLFEGKRTIFKLCHYSKIRFFLMAYIIFLVAHLLMRVLIWKFGHLSEYGNLVYNIVVHSMVYSFVMTAILFLTIVYRSRKK